MALVEDDDVIQTYIRPFVGVTVDTPGPDGIRALSPHHSCGLAGLVWIQVRKVPV